MGRLSAGFSSDLSVPIWLVIMGASNALSNAVAFIIFDWGVDAYFRQEEKKRYQPRCSDVAADSRELDELGKFFVDYLQVIVGNGS